MKRYFAMLLALVLCLGLCACGEKTMGEEVKGGMTDEHVAIVVEVVKEYMETDNFKALAEMTECSGVETAMYYQADGAVEGIDLQLLLVELAMDADITGWNRLLVIDLTEGAAYDAAALDMDNYMGQMDTYEDLVKMTFGGFDSWLMGRNPAVMTELEVRTPATDAQIGEINAALGK